MKKCKNCKYFSYTTIGMESGACWKSGSMIYGETGQHKEDYVCRRVPSDEYYCADWEDGEIKKE